MTREGEPVIGSKRGVECYKEEGSVANHLELIACETVESELRKTTELSKETYGSTVEHR